MNQLSHPVFTELFKIIKQVEDTQTENIINAAKLTATSLLNNGFLQVFGSGHSHMMVEEMFFRAGGLTQINAIFDADLMLHISASGSTKMERLEGFASLVMDRYEINRNDIMLIISNSGRNAVPIEAAIYAKEKGLKVIVLTSWKSYKDTNIRHSSKKHLANYADIVIDTCIPEGDAIICMQELPEKICPASTIVNAAILQSFVYEVVKETINQGAQPQIFISANVDQKQDMTQIITELKNRVKHY